MSNHTIGYGMNEVVATVVSMKENNEISFEACKKIIDACMYVALEYDGNRYEVVECLNKNCCGHCYKEIEPKSKKIILDLWEVPNELIRNNLILSEQLCEECYRKLSKKYDLNDAVISDD